uniref:C2H2-type domain-containing protein n=1 Tax=Meloidogyne incognita TaxID=6306 RepID=A0A914NAH5_MELIC
MLLWNMLKNIQKIKRTHTGVKPYVCKYVDQDGVSCNKEYKRQETLKVHQRNHTGEKIKYKCAHCPQTFTSQRGKYYHEKRKHAACSNADNEAVVRTFFLIMNFRSMFSQK